MVNNSTKSRPFVHKFETAHHKYLFDVNTNRVLRTDPVTWDIIDDIGDLATEQIIRKYAGLYDAEAIVNACEEIEQIQQAKKLLMPVPTKLATLSEFEKVKSGYEDGQEIITLKLSANCNFRCTYCVWGGGYQQFSSSKNMSWETAKLAIDRFLNAPYHNDEVPRIITFYGGEPLLDFPVLRKCVEYVRSKLGDQIHFLLITNGWFLSGGIARFIGDNCISIQLSLDGPAHIHDYRRRLKTGSPTYARVMDNVREFIRKYPQYPQAEDEYRGYSLSFNATLSPLMNALEVARFFKSEVRDMLGYYPSVTIGTELRMKFSPSEERLAIEDCTIPGLATLRQKYLAGAAQGAINSDPNSSNWNFCRALFDKSFWFFRNRQIAPAGKTLYGASSLQGMCFPGMRRVLVDVDGSYYPCDSLPFKIGDVSSGIDVEQSYRLVHDFATLSQEECRSCWCLNYCSLGCCVGILEGKKLSSKAKQTYCEHCRHDTHKMLVQFHSTLEKNKHAFDYLK